MINSAHRVRRSEAFTSSPSPPSRPTSPKSPQVLDPDTLESFPGLAFDYEERHVPGRQRESPLAGDQADGGETFEFRLFASKTRLVSERGQGSLKEKGLAKINIRSPSPTSGDGDGGLVVPFRPHSYYFTPASDEEGGEGDQRRKRFADAAIDGKEVLSGARRIAWVRHSPREHSWQGPSLTASQPGAALPWRVIHIPASGLARSLRTLPATSESPGSGAKRKVRAGKKRRIASRKKNTAVARAAEAEKEKKTRKNREKKLKKREKNRNLKAQGLELGSGRSASPKGPV
jgi:Fungal protein of unknown function (DUF2011)